MCQSFRSLLFLLVLIVPFIASAGVIHGVVRDSKGAPLPFATVFLKGTTIGTATNAQGVYQLNVSPGKYTVICQFISYKQESAIVTVAGNESVAHDFTLQEQNFEMKEVVVNSSEDPAYRIMRKVIAQRAFHLKQVKAFQTGIYLKGVLRTRKTPNKVLGQKIDSKGLGLDSAGKGVLYLCEEVADYYAQEPNKERTVIHSVRESGNPNGFGFAQVPPVVTFYENNVNLGEGLNPRGFISPAADGALGYYKYKLVGEFTEDRHIIYKIQVTPKRQYEPLFFGHMYIVADDWAIHSLSLATTAKTGIDFLDTLRIDQVFLPLKHDTWVVKSQLFYPVLNIFGFGITGNFVTIYDNQKVNEPVPDTIFHKKIISQYDKDANKRDTAYWEETRPIPLEKDELHDYHFKDSIARRDTSFRYTDSLRRRHNRFKAMDIFLNGKTFVGKYRKQTFSFTPLLMVANYNTVEGFNLAPQFEYTRRLDTGYSLHIRAAIRYGFENTHFNAITAISYSHSDRTWAGRGWTAILSGGQYVFQFNPDNPALPLFNTYTTLANGYNYMKIYERREVSPAFVYRGGNGLRWLLRLSYQERLPLENTVSFTYGHSTDKITPNYPEELSDRFPWYQHKAFIGHIGISYQPGYTYILLPDRKQPQSSDAPTFTLSYTKGIPNVLDSKVDYDKWRLGIMGEFRLRLAGSLAYNLSVGGFLNNKKVFAPDLMHIYEGDDHFFTIAPTYLKGFQLAKYYYFSNDAPLYGEAHIEYNLRGLITNKIPLFRQLKWYFILGSNAFYANDNLNITEAFISLDNIGFKVYRFLRFDYVHAWTGDGRSYDGIRLGIRGINLRKAVADEQEW